MNNKVELLDGITGSGKSTSIFEFMNNNPQERYIYISPTLTEVVERVVEECGGLDFVSPDTEEYKTKSEHLLELLQGGYNIAATHALFEAMNKEHFRAIKAGRYITIVDETLGMISPYTGVTYSDVNRVIRSGDIEINHDDFGKVSWVGEDNSKSLYSKFRRMCLSSEVFATKGDNPVLVASLPDALLHSSKRTIVLTYLFKGSVFEAYLNLRGFEVVEFKDTTLASSEEDLKSRARDLITFGTTRSVEGVKGYSQSYNWFSKTATQDELEELSRAIRSVYRKYDSESIMFTSPKEVILPKGKTKDKRSIKHPYVPLHEMYVHSRIRATNKYDYKTVLIHSYNRFLPIVVKNYFRDYGIKLSDDEFALSETVQWVYRSAIRKGLPVTIYFTNNRMERIFKEWLYSV